MNSSVLLTLQSSWLLAGVSDVCGFYQALAVKRSTSLTRMEAEVVGLKKTNKELQQALQQAQADVAKEKVFNANVSPPTPPGFIPLSLHGPVSHTRQTSAAFKGPSCSTNILLPPLLDF